MRHIIMMRKNESVFYTLHTTLYCDICSTSIVLFLKPQCIHPKVQAYVVPELVNRKILSVEDIRYYYQPLS